MLIFARGYQSCRRKASVRYPDLHGRPTVRAFRAPAFCAFRYPRGYVWEPDRNTVDNKEFITFIAQVEGLSAVPDGRIYMNAFIDTIKGTLDTKKGALRRMYFRLYRYVGALHVACYTSCRYRQRQAFLPRLYDAVMLFRLLRTSPVVLSVCRYYVCFAFARLAEAISASTSTLDSSIDCAPRQLFVLIHHDRVLAAIISNIVVEAEEFACASIALNPCSRRNQIQLLNESL